MPPLNITTLTPATVQQNLQNDGLGSLGLTTLTLSPKWADSAPTYNATDLTLGISGDIRAPFLGIRRHAFQPVSSTLANNINSTATTITLAADSDKFPIPNGGPILLTISNGSGSKREVVSCTARNQANLTVTRGMDNTAKQDFSAGDRVTVKLGGFLSSSRFLDVNGIPLNGACTVLELHPQAVLRLERLAVLRHGQPGDLPFRPVPWAMVVRGVQGFSTARWFRADEVMTGTSGNISFHDGRGQIIDPVYVAALFDDLQIFLPGIVAANPSGPANGTGGTNSIASLANGTLIHFVDPHGGAYRPAVGFATMETGAANNPVPVPASGLVTLAANQTIRASSGDQGRLRWGWATFGTLARLPLTPPAPANGTLPRDFFRVAVVDAQWALLGNRTANTVLGIVGDDQRIPPELHPIVRDQIVVDYLADGMETLGAATTILSRPNQDMILAVSPDINPQLLTPAQTGANAHWPLFPLPNTNSQFPVMPTLGTNVSAAYVSANSLDVVVTIAGGVAPNGATVRLFPQQFVEIPAITAEPSFLRGNGGSNIADGSGTVSILLVNPFNIAPGQTKPTVLTVDLVIAPRIGRRVLFGAVAINVAAGPATIPPDPFSGPGTILSILDPRLQGIAQSPLFGIPRTVNPPPGPTPTNFIDLVRSLIAEESPRQAARIPTMARFDTLIVTGTTAPGTPQPTGTLLWDAVVTGARWSGESRSDQHTSGNPGNPAGPDVHAPGVRVTGALAYDVALRALRRVQPIIPFPGTNGDNPGWIVASLGNNFNVPSDAANTNNTSIGVLLETVAVGCETPLLSSLNPPAQGLTVQQMLNDAAAVAGFPNPNITINIQNEPRVQVDVRREFFVSKQGLRDAQWSLRRAIREARELVYIESPQFAVTAQNLNVPANHKVDLVNELAQRLAEFPNLQVLICTPREADFAPSFRGWSRRHFIARGEAVSALMAVAPDRVAVFHPVGFPGRPAFIRTTSVIVDDVWSCVGSTHFRRRGMTFDGSTAIASFDRQLEQGYSRKLRAYRRSLMAAKLGVVAPAPPAAASSDWIRLGRPESAFDLVRDLLAQGGLGRIQSLWPGPSDTTIQPVGVDIGDPDGSTTDSLSLNTFVGLLNELGD